MKQDEPFFGKRNGGSSSPSSMLRQAAMPHLFNIALGSCDPPSTATLHAEIASRSFGVFLLAALRPATARPCQQRQSTHCPFVKSPLAFRKDRRSQRQKSSDCAAYRVPLRF